MLFVIAFIFAALVHPLVLSNDASLERFTCLSFILFNFCHFNHTSVTYMYQCIHLRHRKCFNETSFFLLFRWSARGLLSKLFFKEARVFFKLILWLFVLLHSTALQWKTQVPGINRYQCHINRNASNPALSYLFCDVGGHFLFIIAQSHPVSLTWVKKKPELSICRMTLNMSLLC